VALYIFGFREGWLWIFPDHPVLAVDLGVFLGMPEEAFPGTDLWGGFAVFLPAATGIMAGGVFSSWTVIDFHVLADGLTATMQTLRGAFFRPNVVFLRLAGASEEERAHSAASRRKRSRPPS